MRADILAGLTTAAVVIPKAMAFAAIAGLPLEAGLYTALIPPLVYAAVGTSRPLSVTTTSTIAILTASALAPFAASSTPAQLTAAAATLAAVAGGALLVAALLRLGFLADFISAPVLTGFKAGIAMVIVVDQIPKLLGVHFTKNGFLQDLVSILRHVPEASTATLALGIALLILIVVLEKFFPTSPAPLLAVAAGIAASGLLGLERLGVELVGEIQSGLPSLALPDPSLARQLWPAALGIALMSFVETIAAGRAFVRHGEPLPTPNRELIAIGLTNLAGSVLQNLPSGGGTSQTAVNRAAGARTQAAGVVLAAAVLASLLFLAPLVALMPQAALAAVVISTTVGLFKPAEFAAIQRVRRKEFVWAVAATAGVVFLGTLAGILAAVTLSVLVLFYQASRPPVYVLGRNRKTGVFEPLTPDTPEVETLPGLLIIRIEGMIHFVNAPHLGARMWVLVHEARPRVILVDLSAVPDLEYTALLGLTEGEEKLREAGSQLWIARLNPRVREVIERSPLGKTLGHERIFASVTQAAEAYERLGFSADAAQRMM